MKEGYRSQLSALTAQYPVLETVFCHHRNQRGKPLNVSNTPYLIEPMTEFKDIPGADIVKAVQTRWTETFLQILFRGVGWDGKIGVYVLPTGKTRNGFVQRRVDPMLRSVAAYRELLPFGEKGEKNQGRKAENLGLKHFGPNGKMMFIGSNADDQFFEWSADLAIVDEYDLCNQRNIVYLDDRLKASEYPQRFNTGNPSVPDTGIERLFFQGDMRRWYFQCDHCRQWQSLDWFVHMVRQNDDGMTWAPRDQKGAEACMRGDEGADIRPVCMSCDLPFQRTTRGLWAPEWPTRDRRSYQMSWLEVLSQRLWDVFVIWQSSQGSTEKVRRFHRSILGRAYEHEGSSVTSGLIQRAATGPKMDVHAVESYSDVQVVAGVDVGSVLNVHISVLERNTDDKKQLERVKHLILSGYDENEPDQLTPLSPTTVTRKARFITAVGGWDALKDLLLRFKVDLVVIDAQPETHKAQEFRDEMAAMYNGPSVWLCRFHPQGRVGSEDFAMKLDNASKVVIVDRTQLLDACLDDLIHGRSILPVDIRSVKDYDEQMRTPKRVLSDRGDRYVWSKDGADHYRFAHAYERVAAEILQRGGSFSVFE